MKKPVIGFIGQGWIGKNYANDFERRGYKTIRFALEAPHNKNEHLIKDCDIVFIAVPTPTIKEKFDTSILKNVLKYVGKGKTAVIKSTILPGTVEALQKENPNIFVFHSPEFLTESNAAYDAAHPLRNIIGVPKFNKKNVEKAKEVLKVLPKAPYELVCQAQEAELIKYAGNCFFYFKVTYVNLLFDLAQKLGCHWEIIRDAIAADPRIGRSHLNPVHKSGEKGGEANAKFNGLHRKSGGRGAGGHCFIKDFSAFSKLYEKMMKDPAGQKVLKAVEHKNIHLLANSQKDLDLLLGVYGEKRITALKNSKK